MRFVLSALRRFGWLLPLAGALGALVAYLADSRARAVRYEATAHVGGRRAVELLRDPATAQLGNALAVAHEDARDLAKDYWKTADEDALGKLLGAKGLLADPARWPEVRVSAPTGVTLDIQGERATAVAAEPGRALAAANARAKAAELVGASRLRGAAARVEGLRTRLELIELEAAPLELGVRELERRMAAVQGSADAIERQVEEVKARRERAESQIRTLEAAEHRLREALPVGPENGLTSALYEKLTAEREAVRAERALKMAGRTAEDPEVRRLTQRMADLELEIRKELYIVRDKTIVGLRNQMDAHLAELRTLDERRDRKLLEIRELGEKIREASPRHAEHQRVRDELVAAETHQRELGDPSIPLASVTGEAVDVLRSGGARGRVVAAWAGLGIAAGFGLALLLRGGDRRVRSGEDVKRRLNVGVIGVASEIKGDPLLLRQPAAAADWSFAAGVLRAYLSEREFRVVLVTSAGAGEGKSTSAANLAVALARKGLNVALVDADLAAPRQGQNFNLDESMGLTSILQGQEIQADLPAGVTELVSLRVLPAGPVNELPAELLESPRMAELLQALRERYDVVVIDGPPLGVGGDAVTLARLADTVAWVVRAGRLPANRLGWAKHVLKNVGADVAGVLLLGTSDGAAEREYHYPAEAVR